MKTLSSRTKSLRFGLIGLLAVFALFAAGCGGSDDGGSDNGDTDSGGGLSVAAVFPGPIDDHSWNQAGYEGLQRLEADGAEIEYTESVAQDQQLESLRGYAQKGADVVIAHGGQFMDDADRVAADFPDTHFVVINGERGANNVSSLGFSYPEIGYIAGALAAARTETGQVGIVAGLKLPVIDMAVEGFEAGAASIDPKVQVKTVITGSFDDVDKAREQSLALVSGGVDVLWPILNAAETGVYSAAEDEGVMSIGFYGDVTSLAPTSFIGSPKADPGDLVYAAGTDEALRNGQANALTVADGQLGIGELPEGTPAEVQTALEEAVERLRSGEAGL